MEAVFVFLWFTLGAFLAEYHHRGVNPGTAQLVVDVELVGSQRCLLEPVREARTTVLSIEALAE